MSINPNPLFIDESTLNKNNCKTNLWCQLCDYLIKSSEDIEYSKKYGCCEECWLTFGQMRKEKWSEGWRPDSEMLNRYKEKRRILNIDIKNLLRIENESK